MGPYKTSCCAEAKNVFTFLFRTEVSAFLYQNFVATMATTYGPFKVYLAYVNSVTPKRISSEDKSRR